MSTDPTVAAAPAAASQPAARRTARLAALAMAAGGGVMWAAGRMPWLQVEIFDDKSGAATHTISGSTWSTEIAAVAFVVLVAAIAGFALRRLGRRVAGLVAAVGAVAASYAPLAVIAGEPQAARAHALLTAGTTVGQSGQARITAWATVETITVQPAGVWLAFAGCALALMGGIVLALRPGADSAKRSAYDTAAARRQRLASDLERVADSPEGADDAPRVMWDALDADIDPTQR
ncbi:TIGR02234 family membrane protein [Corynebacterium sp. 13CS0277]|uniref:TIGR02234 family membrane protein n=1 Tax=Corynebacterium sp. 13CS0277 TaxID=2071994 RepID=UPI000D040949|nr:TIGR02234 family membrane protein [Corynebacterium sp. 13CS0277]PRQ12517.1 TIGR02234 family membrane protein [Corynebacterium sp. 13CS0277]